MPRPRSTSIGARVPLLERAGVARPVRDRRRIRVRGLGRGRQPLPRLLEPARQHEHRSHASEGRGRDPGAGGAAADSRAGARQPAPAAWRPSGSSRSPATRSRPSSSRTAARTRTRTPSASRASRPGATRCSPPYRSYHGNTGAAIVATGDWRRDAERVRPRPRALLRAVPVPQRVLVVVARAGGRARAARPRADRPGRGAEHDRRAARRDRARHRRRARAAARLARRAPRHRRPLRHRADLRRGDGGLRPHGRLVRVAERAAEPARASCPTSSPSPRASTRATCPPAACSSRRRSPAEFDDQRVPRRPHLQRASARDGVDRRLDRRDATRRGSSTTPPGSARTCSAPPCTSSPSVTRSSARCAASACSGRSSWSDDRATREPLPAADMAGIKRRADGRGPAAVRAGQPHPRRAAVHRHGRGGPARGRDPRRRPAVGARESSRRSGESGRHAALDRRGGASRRNSGTAR